MKKHFVEFSSPGTLVPEITIQEIDSWDVKEATSGFYFLGGKIKTLQDVIKDKGETSILASNMRCNKWDCVIENNNSHSITFPFKKQDTLLDWD